MEYAFYLMEENTYLNNCLSIVCKLTPEEVLENNLTGENILIFIKFGKNLKFKEKDTNFKGLINSQNFQSNQPILLRLSSECLFGIFGDSHCDCEVQRINALEAINKNGQGIYIQLPQEAQSRGLFYKAQELSLQVTGHTPEGKYIGEKSILEACDYLTGMKNVDIRKFEFLKNIFKDLGLNKLTYVLITDSIKKSQILSEKLDLNIIGNIEINRKISTHNIAGYLEKIYSADYMLDDDDIIEIINIISSQAEIPDRAVIMLKKICESISEEKYKKYNIELLNLLCSIGQKYIK